MFVCAFPTEISSIFGMSFPFCFPYFVLFRSFFRNIDVKAFPQMFKTWHWYVDEIFAVIPKRHIQDALTLLNIQVNSLRFAFETEIEGQLPFFDLIIIVNFNRLTFDTQKTIACSMLHIIRWLQFQVIPYIPKNEHILNSILKNIMFLH